MVTPVTTDLDAARIVAEAQYAVGDVVVGDTIHALIAEVERLRLYEIVASENAARRSAAEAEVERLRWALAQRVGERPRSPGGRSR